MITQNELKKLLSYIPDTGIFTWKVQISNIKLNDIAGSIDDKGYRCIWVKNKKYLAHRLAWLYMTGAFPINQIDHINHIRDDNKFFNLREVTDQENKKNTSLKPNNTSGFNGVSWRKSRKKWQAQIQLNGKKKFLGHFINKEDAIKVRKEANIKYGFHENHGT